MAAAKEEVKKIKIKLLQDCCFDGVNILKAGVVVEVDEATAAEFCDRKFEGYMPFYGYMPEMVLQGPSPLDRQVLTRAVRVA